MKAVLVIDLPEDYMGDIIEVELYGKTQTIYRTYVNKLRPLPKKMDIEQFEFMWGEEQVLFAIGYNRCVDEIEGETDE